ncbi:hypothetical protein BU25DRAFT_423933 [Macroventuria anomochaeta]|uniref:Uncharacterized protein n=1 Tax=Macroventuria anomochaeta TaxID=301207 RepID=A0ACB6RUR3_9PLEO|nr:uncharacterized protein BU25DRAFT_423933 [Macroventuria anomochaeta]KAF2624833.1 hypothetical protein BU25DRAFT_423933 [Macroventuria anomochaeta]
MAVDSIGDQAEREAQQSISPDDVIIVIMGMTGAGKSSFIAHCTQYNPPYLRQELRSCTTQVSVHTIQMAERTVHLIDTPGFNDSLRSDGETFQELAYWLAAAHENKLKLSGIVYLHRITDTRMHGSAHRALETFKAICGAQGFRGVVVATTMWDGLVGYEIQKAHARQEQSTMTLALQTEHVDQGLQLHRTEAGRIIYDNFRTFLDLEKLSADEAGSNTAKVLEPLHATRQEVRAAWSARIRQEDAALECIQQKSEEHASLWHLPCHCSCLVGLSSAARSSQGSSSTSAASEILSNHPKRTQVNSWVDQESKCESLRLQQEVVVYRRRHKLDRRHIAHGRTTTIGIAGTGLAVAQLAAAIACNVM